jgi:hypothetical protein
MDVILRVVKIRIEQAARFQPRPIHRGGALHAGGPGFFRPDV